MIYGIYEWDIWDIMIYLCDIHDGIYEWDIYGIYISGIYECFSEKIPIQNG